MDYESVIGLEVHAELMTESKIFSGASAHFGGEANSHIDAVTLGLPGTLPVLNESVVEMGVLAGLATDCTIAKRCKFDRKHYFYPDLPKGYQITQFDYPIAESGGVAIDVEGVAKVIRLNRIHIEEDAGKLVHAGADRLNDSRYSLVDYNRAGVPLLEIVSEPDLRNSQEARAYVENLRAILMAIGVCDGKMQEGSLRVDINVSVRPKGEETLGTRVELKNINSFKFLQKAIDYEVSRQIAAVESGELIRQETRLWDEHKNRTVVMRSKEDAQDYRYFPDPDLTWVELSSSRIEELKASLPELPAAKKLRYQTDLELTEYDAHVLVNEPEWTLFFESALEAGGGAKELCRWIVGDIAAWLNEEKKSLSETALTAQNLCEMLSLIEQGTISGKIAKKILPHLLTEPTPAKKVVEKMGLTQISDTSAISDLIETLLDSHSKEVEQFLNGKEKVIGFFVGQVMKQTRGRANPGQTNQLLREALEKRRV